MKDPNELMSKLLQYNDPESAIAVYKEIAGYLKQFKEIQDAAKKVVELHLETVGEFEVITGAGKAAYTQPKTPKLNKEKWATAMSRDQALAEVQSRFNEAENALDVAQTPFKELPPGYLRIT